MAEAKGPCVPCEAETQGCPTGRRKERRFALDQEPPCRLVLLDPREAWWARVHDVSTSGAGLLLAQRPTPGRRLTLELGAPAGAPLVREARVIHAAAEPGLRWRAGLAFDHPLAAEEFESLLRS